MAIEVLPHHATAPAKARPGLRLPALAMHTGKIKLVTFIFIDLLVFKVSRLARISQQAPPSMSAGAKELVGVGKIWRARAI